MWHGASSSNNLVGLQINIKINGGGFVRVFHIQQEKDVRKFYVIYTFERILKSLLPFTLDHNYYFLQTAINFHQTKENEIL